MIHLYGYLKACFSIISVPLTIKRMEWRRKNFKPVVYFTHLKKKKASFLRPVWRLLVSESISLLSQLCYVWPPEKQELRQNSAHTQFIRGSACGKMGEQAGEGVQEGWLTVCWQPHSPFQGLPCASAVSSSLLTAACDAWDLSESSRCFWSLALILGQSALSPDCLSSWNTVLSVLYSVGWRKGWTVSAGH